MPYLKGLSTIKKFRNFFGERQRPGKVWTPCRGNLFGLLPPPPRAEHFFFTDDPLKWEILINIAKLLERKSHKGS